MIPLPAHEKLLAWEGQRSVNQGRPRAELSVLPLLLWWSPKSFWKVLWERRQSLGHSARPAGCWQGGWWALLAFSHRAGRLLKRDTCLKLFLGSTKKFEWLCVSALALLLLYGPVRNAGRVFMSSLRLRQLRLRSVREPSPEPRGSTQRLNPCPLSAFPYIADDKAQTNPYPSTKALTVRGEGEGKWLQSLYTPLKNGST